MPSQSLDVRELSRDDHRVAIAARRSVSFLQTPAWADVKSDWRSTSVGWFDGDALVGVGLILFRKAPRINRYLAYLPEGPDIDWEEAAKSGDLDRWLQPLATFVKARQAFALRIGPRVVTRQWDNTSLKAGLADDSVTTMGNIPPSESTSVGESLATALTELGWRPPDQSDGFAAGQPRYVFQLPLAGRSEEDLLRGFNQLWRRNIKKADKAGVEVTLGSREDLAVFHQLYTETAHRDGFTPRPESYFYGMYDAMTAEEPDRFRLYLAHHDDDLVAATIMIRVGAHAWYSYGASSNNKREVRGSNAIQWRMITDALADGCDVYDLRGITDTLDSNDPHAGLIRFKLGTGGHAVEYLGEWTLPLSRVLYTAFDLYMKRRG